MYNVSVSFKDLEVAKNAAELMSLTFPMLQFNLDYVPELDLTFNNEQGFLHLFHDKCKECKYFKSDVLFSPCRECKHFNIYNDKEHFVNATIKK